MMYLKDVVTLEFNQEKCIKCGRCIEVCPREVFIKTNIIELSNRDACIECGACKMNCPTGAITVQAGTGCAIAIMSRYFKNSKWLKPFAKKDCC